ncbi:unnamed protein product [Parascedosporium putredinis]|uniref:Conserved oligomeric Golgi complex subunit 1 n=1 Tax=Parascedosporium putredinis TaxID=1442378 RepID=A0A9P1MD82_9PEZI|nr:unnamed protein product [Parascedosporium putredinis]CAI8003115.1 unnamed protein product [Parascedosporium putredinis]
MAAPDISTFTSADEVFAPNHTLPQIRAIHKTIHEQLEEKASRLRSQVGGSYRELLGTADTIVAMKGDNDAVRTIAGMAGFSAFLEEESKVPGSRLAPREAGRLKLIEACILTVARALRGGGVGVVAAAPSPLAPFSAGAAGADAASQPSNGDRLLLAAKASVLGRLLVKTFGQGVADERAKASVEAAIKSLDSLRQKLVGRVNRLLRHCGTDQEQDDLAKALAAYGLVTNSGARDVLSHFLRVRGKALATAFEVEESERERSARDVSAALGLYIRTLIDVQALAPYKISEVLLALKRYPLVEDVSLRKMEILRLDIYQRWCSDEVQTFTPFIQHGDLDVKQAKEMLGSWAKKASDVLIKGLVKTLDTMSEFKSIVELRTSEMLDRLREAINGRLLALLETKVGKLNLVGSEVAATLEHWREGVTDNTQAKLWDVSTYDMEMTNGVAAFIQEVVSRLHGSNDAVSKAVNSYNSWRHVIEDVDDVVEHLRKQRWDTDIDDLEDDDVIELRQEALAKTDPGALKAKLDACLQKSFKTLEERLAALWHEREDSPNSGRIAMFFIRVLRDIRRGLPPMESIRGFGLGIVPSLHQKAAHEVSISAIDEFASRVITRLTVPSRPLWEGSPELPTQCSPAMSLFLKELLESMSDAGIDLWSPTAVNVLKGIVSAQVSELWTEALGKLPQGVKAGKSGSEATPDSADQGDAKQEEKEEEAIAEADTEAEENEKEAENEQEMEKEEVDEKTVEVDDAKEASLSEEGRKELLTQWFFDVTYLARFFETVETSKEEFEKLAKKIYEQSGLDDDGLKQRIIKSTEEYWRRTNLMFGLL